MNTNAELYFSIDGRQFKTEGGFDGVQSFIVQSAIQPYSVTWDDSQNPLAQINDLMNHDGNLLLIDQNVFDLYSHSIAKIQSGRIFKAPATEEFKTLQGVTDVIQFLEDNGFTKGQKLITVGGGIIQDVSAFVGASYKRGISWDYFPTTLLSMCDSCIGAKASINHHGAKNQLGLFSAPSRIVINPGFLETLDPREINSGLGEVLKLHITGGETYLEKYRRHAEDPWNIGRESFKELIFGSLFVKKSVIEVDEFDRSYRKALNYGHTVGHAVEVLSNFRIPHGQAIIVGMMVANELSCNRSYLDWAIKERLERIFLKLLDVDRINRLSLDGLQDLLRKDKKSTGTQIHFAILKSLGELGFLSLSIEDELIEEIKGIIRDIGRR